MVRSAVVCVVLFVALCVVLFQVRCDVLCQVLIDERFIVRFQVRQKDSRGSPVSLIDAVTNRLAAADSRMPRGRVPAY